jgi:hypothetical protein
VKSCRILLQTIKNSDLYSSASQPNMAEYAIKLLYSFRIDCLLADFVRILQYSMGADWFSAAVIMCWFISIRLK